MESNKIFSVLTLLFINVFLASSLVAQVAENRYIVFFTDKDNTPYSIDDPGAYLSQRAIARRVSQNIAIDSLDLPVNPAYIQAVKNLGEVDVLYPLKWSNGILIETTDPDVIQGVTDLSIVDRLEVSRRLFKPDETVTKAYGLPKNDADYGPSLNQIEMLNGLGLHNDGFRGAGIWIAILDGGFDKADSVSVLDSLFADQRIHSTYNFVDDTSFAFTRSSHGTKVLSTMAGDQIEALIGTAPEATYILEVTEDVYQERRIEEAFWEVGAEYADSVGADIINSSLGYTEFDVLEDYYSISNLDGNTALVTRMADVAASRGMLVVVAAGNSGDDPWHYIGFPADGDSVLAIGAVYPNEVVTDFSSRGPSADGRVKPNVMAQGGFTIITDMEDGIQTGSGTSFASPVLAGMAACLWQAFPEATAWQVFQAIEKSASLFEMPNDSMGFGIPDFELARQLLQQVLGVENPMVLDEIQTLRIAPNPYSNGLIKIDFPASAHSKFEASVYSLSGNTILYRRKFSHISAFENRLSRCLQNSASGTYIVFLQSEDNGTFVGKVVKE